MKRKVLVTNTEPIIPPGYSASITFVEDAQSYYQELQNSPDTEIVSDTSSIDDVDEIFVVKMVALSYKINRLSEEQTEEQNDQKQGEAE